MMTFEKKKKKNTESVKCKLYKNTLKYIKKQ